MTPTDYDALIIGGGSTGLGVTLDLALRGLRVALVERHDLTDGTSGRYHGLLHSGGRYAATDPESARECIAENSILRRIAPHAIEDTGGFFVSTPRDDPGFGDRWLAACHDCGIDAEEISVAAALREEPAMDPAALRIFRVPDASCDSFDLIEALAVAVTAHGGSVLTYHEITGLDLESGHVSAGATVRDLRTGEVSSLRAGVVVNAAGAWAGLIAGMAGCRVMMRPNKGTLVAMAYRFVNTILNRCHKPGDGDILVPVGTVCVIGTTSVPVEDPNETGVQAWEIQKLLDEGEALVPGFSRVRALRAWAGVRPLYEEERSGDSNAAQGREVKRTFAVLDHAERDGVPGLVTVTGGKLTTYRLMAQRAPDVACKSLGVTRPSVTLDFNVSDYAPGAHGASKSLGATPSRDLSGLPGRPGRTVSIARTRPQPFHILPRRLAQVEAHAEQDSLVCECELVTRSAIERAAAGHDDITAPWILDDLRRDLRLGMGPCQGGFCNYRAAGILEAAGRVDPGQATHDIVDFAERRWKGQRPLLWGQSLRQALLDEHIYRGILGLDRVE